MSERDEELGRALAGLPVPEPSAQFWDALRARCTEAFETAPEVTAHVDGAGSFSHGRRKLRRPRRPRAGGHEATGGPPDPTPSSRRRGRRFLRQAPRLVTVAVAVAVVTLASSLLTGLVRRAEAVSVIPLSPECGHDGNTPVKDGPRLVVAGVWQEGTAEADNLIKVLNAFQKQSGAGVILAYVQTRRDMAPELSKRIDNGCPPDVALLPQPGLLRDLARQHKLRPLVGRTAQRVEQNYTEPWRQLGTVDGTLYGVWFKATNKSLIWSRPDEFGRTEPPQTWDELKDAAARIHDQGRVAPFSLAGADGWTLTDWFENVYLATAGPEMYDRLANQAARDAIPWTDPSVKQALAKLAEIFGRPEWLAGGTEGALRTSYESSVESVLGPSPRAAMVYEGDFVAAHPRDVAKGSAGGVTLRSFEFPAIGDSKPLVVGGDVAVSLTNNDAGRKLMEFLASPQAAEVWAKEAGFLSPNKSLDPGVYPDDATRSRAKGLTESQTLRFDLSDLQPSEFGGSEGMWQLFQDFLRNPGDIDGITQRLQGEAQAAWALPAPLRESQKSAAMAGEKGHRQLRR